MSKWECRLCGSNAYERHGGHPEPAYKVIKNEDGTEVRKPITYTAGRHFMCRGCSVFFANPRKFNRLNEDNDV